MRSKRRRESACSFCNIFFGRSKPLPYHLTFATRTFHDCNAIISRTHRIHFKTKGHFIASRRDVEDAIPYHASSLILHFAFCILHLRLRHTKTSIFHHTFFGCGNFSAFLYILHKVRHKPTRFFGSGVYLL